MSVSMWDYVTSNCIIYTRERPAIGPPLGMGSLHVSHGIVCKETVEPLEMDDGVLVTEVTSGGT